MKKSITTHEAKTHLSKIIEDVLGGDEVTICRGKSPVVRIVKYHVESNRSLYPKVGTVTSARVKYDVDAFAPLGDEDMQSWGTK